MPGGYGLCVSYKLAITVISRHVISIANFYIHTMISYFSNDNSKRIKLIEEMENKPNNKFASQTSIPLPKNEICPFTFFKKRNVQKKVVSMRIFS